MNPTTDTGASEILANLSISTVVLIAFGLTVLRLLLLQPGQPARPGQAPSVAPWARGLAEILESLIIAGVLVFLIIRPFFVQAFFIPSESMEPTLLGHDAGMSVSGNFKSDTVHDHIFVNKLVYRYSEPRRGDIIVFRAPKVADKLSLNQGRDPVENVLIKRLMGIPGDTIEVKEGAVYRNGQRLAEFHNAKLPYTINEPMKQELESGFDFAVPCSLSAKQTCGPVKLGPNELWVMGDNRNDSNDSRYWGKLDRSRVIGKAEIIFWPLNRIRLLK